ncbi:probable splicing factor YJU2B isoform X1 [Patella vulgata]|uniref:probable splicing factor YJU2B isoform X1 n=1 Tax=Patella vulgata TaxID=6465 RepID=UPI00217F3756|nr:probable splicing factor YJU2B isoform X1 [Patella vulgata]
MAERKAVNKYYPPDWDPSKGSINTHVGQHPLRDRAKKIKQGILVIRFEMPYNIWCGGCNAHIGMGVRYNAEKSKNGNYYSTPIYKFRMKCHLCDNYFEIQTDPQNHDYVILSGARRKEQRWDPKENGQIETEDKLTQKKMATDAMFKLEHGSDDKQKGEKAVMTIYQLEDRKESYKEDYLLNKLARNKFRTEKNNIRDKKMSDQALLDKSSLDIELVEENADDKRIAGLMKYSVTDSYEIKQKEKRKSICNQPIFNVCNSSSPSNNFLSRTISRPDPFSVGLTKRNSTSPKDVYTNLGIRRKSKSDLVSNSSSPTSIDSPNNIDKLLPDEKLVENKNIENLLNLSKNMDNDVNKCVKASSSEISDNGVTSSLLVDNMSNTGLDVLMTSYSDSDSDV